LNTPGAEQKRHTLFMFEKPLLPIVIKNLLAETKSAGQLEILFG
jgi:hypothetical protein